jgi:hypothetical protein
LSVRVRIPNATIPIAPNLGVDKIANNKFSIPSSKATKAGLLVY